MVHFYLLIPRWYGRNQSFQPLQCPMQAESVTRKYISALISHYYWFSELCTNFDTYSRVLELDVIRTFNDRKVHRFSYNCIASLQRKLRDVNADLVSQSITSFSVLDNDAV